MTRLRKRFATELLSIWKINKYQVQRKSPTLFPVLLQVDSEKCCVKMHVPLLKTSFFCLYNHKNTMKKLSQFLKLIQKYHFFIALTLFVK